MRPPGRHTLALAIGAFVTASALSGGAQTAADIPSPDAFFGFPIGAERRLVDWHAMVEYLRLIDARSDRVLVEDLGRTTMGLPYLLVTVSAPETIADLPRYRSIQQRLADPRRTSPEEAAALAREGKAVVLVGANVHATEIGTSQMMNTLVYRLATEETPWVRHVLDNAIVLLIPSQNPDGQQMVVEWHDANLGTPYEDAPLADLYHPYAGHDNNRDSYMLTQVETRHLNRVLYQDWLPEVYLDKHQMGSTFARIFVPPFKNPPNPNVDPLVWSEVNLLGQAMAAKLHEADKTGVIWGELYSGFWQGANSTNPWWHNMVALLTEVASPRLATTIHQERADAGQSAGAARVTSDGLTGPARRDPDAPLAAPSDVQYRMNYPRPWLGGPWSLGDAVEYQLLATMGLLEGVAGNREMLKRNFYVMNRRAIDRFAAGSPYAYLIPASSPDPAALAKLLYLLQAGAAEVHVANAAFVADGREYPAGTYVVRLAQPFGRWVKDLLEPQSYPDIRWPHPSAPIDKPYDVTAWSLGMLMGVETIQIETPFDAPLTALTSTAPPPGRVTGTGATYVLSHAVNGSFIAMNRLLDEGAAIRWAATAVEAAGRTFEPGAILVSGVAPDRMARLADELSLEVVRVDIAADQPGLAIPKPRLALYEPWGGSIDAGWTRWVLEQHEFAYAHLRGQDLTRGDLLGQFDVIVIPEMASADILRGLQGRSVRPEHRGGIGAEGVRRLRAFVEEGGTVITLGNAAAFAIEHLGAPVANVVRDVSPEAFYCPGSILRIEVDRTHPLGYGMPAEADAMFVNNGGYLPVASPDATPVRIVARYPNRPLLRSGWIIGDDALRGAGAVVEATAGKGRLILETFRVQHRGQTWGTFRLLFNAIFYGPAVRGRPAAETTFGQL